MIIFLKDAFFINIMKILILGALDEEIEFLLRDLTDKTETNWNGNKIFEGSLYGKDVILAKSGVGKVNSAMITQHLIDSYHFNYLLFTGVAGSLGKDIHVGDVIVAEKLFQHDMDVRSLGYKLGQVPGLKQLFFECDKRLLKIAENVKISGYKVKKGIIATGDQFVDHNHNIKKDNSYNANCVEMEGASVAQVSMLNNIPFLVIRIISDNADDTSSGDFRSNLPLFAKNSQEIIKQVLRGI